MPAYFTCDPRWVRSDGLTRIRTATGWKVTRETWFIDRRGEKDCVIEEWDEPP